MFMRNEFYAFSGIGDIDNGTAYGVNDPQRIRFYNGHLRAVHEAIQ